MNNLKQKKFHFCLYSNIFNNENFVDVNDLVRWPSNISIFFVFAVKTWTNVFQGLHVQIRIFKEDTL